MTIEEFHTELSAFLKELPSSGFDAVSDDSITELNTLSGKADTLGMKTGKQLVINLIEALETHKTGGNTDESVQIRLTALDFYVKKLQTCTTEDL